jgi:Putative peptidoglycan binding domain
MISIHHIKPSLVFHVFDLLLSKARALWVLFRGGDRLVQCGLIKANSGLLIWAAHPGIARLVLSCSGRLVSPTRSRQSWGLAAASKCAFILAMAVPLTLALPARGHAAPCEIDLAPNVNPTRPRGAVLSPYQALPDQSRRELQWALIWAGRYSQEVDGIIGPETVEAIKSFQEGYGGFPTGRLSEEEKAALFRIAASRRRALGFTVVRDEQAGFAAGLPLAYVPFERATGKGSLYRSSDGEIEIQTLRFQDGRTLCDLHACIAGLPGRQITTSSFRDRPFVMSGFEGDKTFFMQAFEDGGGAGSWPEIRALSVSYPKSRSTSLHPLIVAMWNTFDRPEPGYGLAPTLTPQQIHERMPFGRSQVTESF